MKTSRLPQMLMIMALTISLGFHPGSVQGATEPLTDQGITDAIEHEIIFDPAVSLNDLTIHTQNGIVTLSGSTDNLLARERAARLAETVKGVRSVVNEIDVEPYWGQMDWEIENNAEQALGYNLTTESYEVNVDVKNNTATLTGAVESWPEKRLSEKVVKSVRGVAKVVNMIEVEYDRQRTETEILNDVASTLKWNALVDAETINVEVEDSTVHLSGVVGSAAEKRQAIENAYVAGVTAVDAEDLSVIDWAKDPMQRDKGFVPKSESAVEAAISDALAFDPRVSRYSINVEVNDHTAVLRGTVDHLAARRAAAETAGNTVGVREVKNRIKVRPSTPTDAQIEENIEDALVRNPVVERFDIRVNVENGSAYLTGTVDSYYEKGQADQVAASAYGVTDVVNGLVVDGDEPLYYDPYVYDNDPYAYDWYDYSPPRSFKRDADIREDAREQMVWSPFVDAEEVKIQVEDDVAILTGTVDSWLEKRKATENAYEGGAAWVENELVVK